MSFYDVKSPGDVIQSSDWNAFTDFTEAISGIAYKHSGNRLIHSPSSNLKIWFDSLYSPTGLQTGLWSGASEFYSFSSNAQSLYHPSGLVISGQEYSKAVASAQIALYDETYSSEGDLTSVLDDNYAGSGAFKTHKEDEDIHFPSSQMREWFNALYQESGTSATSDVAWSGALEFYGFSSNVKDDLLSLFSASTSLDNRIDILEGQDVFDHELYSLSSNLYNRAWIDALSGNIDSRIDALAGFDPTEYITSTNAILRFAGSSAALSKYLASSAFKRLNWNSSLWDNSSLIWDNSLQSWKAMKSGGGISQDVAWSSASEFYSFSSNTQNNITNLYAFSTNSRNIFVESGLSNINELADVDTQTSSPSRDQVLKWNGTNWVPAAYDTTFEFSITSFSDDQSTTQLIGTGVWKAGSTLSFTASYENGPPDNSDVYVGYNTTNYWKSGVIGSMTGDGTTGTNSTPISYPSTKGYYLRFILSSNAGTDKDTQTETAIYFYNYVRYGTTSETSGWDSDDINALTGTVTSTYTSTYSINNTTASTYLIFAHPSNYTSLHSSGMKFNSVICPFEPPVTVSVTNSSGYTENYKVYRATNPTLGNSSLVTSTSNTKINNFYWGGTSTESSFSESDVEGLDESQVTNDQTQTWTSVVLDAGEYFLFCFPSRLSTPLFYDNDTGFGFAMEDPEFVNITNVNGHTESYKVFRSEEILGPNTITLRTG